LAARHVPGHGPPAITRVGAGLLNESYRVDRDGRSWSLRIPAAGGTHADGRRDWHCAVLRRAAAARLAPAVEFCDPDAGIVVCPWVAGRTWDAAEAKSDRNQRRFAALLRRVHALQPLESDFRATPAEWVARYRAVLDGGRDAGGAARPECPLRAAADSRLEVLARQRAAAVVCHGDLHPLNLLDDGRSLMLLDWEYAHVTDPFWDLAVWSCANDFDETQRLRLLADYAGGPPATAECERFALLVWLYDYLCLLWHEACSLQRPDLPAPLPAARRAAIAARLARAGGSVPVVVTRHLRQTTQPDDDDP
jgi:thiamine kinase-like enzyme